MKTNQRYFLWNNRESGEYFLENPDGEKTSISCEKAKDLIKNSPALRGEGSFEGKFTKLEVFP